MGASRADTLAGLASALICLLVGLAGLVFSGAEDLLIPMWLWAAVFVAFLATMVLTMAEGFPVSLLRSTFALQVLLGAVLVLTAPTAGWLPILLVFVAAMSTYVVSLPVSLVVVAFNSGVIALASYRITESPTEAVLSAVLYLMLQLATVLGSAAVNRERETHEQLTEAHAELQAAAALQQEASRADERLRIARELHDVLGHRLTALTLELETAGHRSGEQAEHHVDRARGIARGLLADVRDTVGELRRRAPDLREMLDRIAQVPTPQVQITVAPEVCPEEDQTVALVRITQEIVTNAIRHADASVLRINIDAPDGQIRLQAADDGGGTSSVELGNGLRGIVERVQHLGGQVDFDGSDGFRVDVRLAA